MSTRVSESHRTEDSEVRTELERTQAALAKERQRSADLEKAVADQKALVTKWTERALKGPPPEFPIPWILGVFAGILIGSLVWWIPVWLSAPASPPTTQWPVTDGASGGKLLLFIAGAGVVGSLVALGLRRLRPSTPPTQSPQDVVDSSAAQSSNADLTGPP